MWQRRRRQRYRFTWTFPKVSGSLGCCRLICSLLFESLPIPPESRRELGVASRIEPPRWANTDVIPGPLMQREALTLAKFPFIEITQPLRYSPPQTNVPDSHLSMCSQTLSPFPQPTLRTYEPGYKGTRGSISCRSDENPLSWVYHATFCLRVDLGSILSSKAVPNPFQRSIGTIHVGGWITYHTRLTNPIIVDEESLVPLDVEGRTSTT